ncbi:pyruvate, water dikinase [Nitrosophilus alvini]|uniref:pyruvate, water dikinase n=1 Tax=Nitrosophilus alvini TaxID=2714855 RepID=UPI00190D855A|nr:pyruvate, water dikinase [Nitrosophilus alvini]
MKYIKFFKELSNKDVPLVGGKNASLGEMYQELVPMGIKVPNGFAITSDAYWYLLDSAGLREKIKELLQDVDTTDIGVLRIRAKEIREMIFGTPLPKDLMDEILEAYRKLSQEYGMEEADVAVRSSATAEDLPDASFAGQQDTYLNVQGKSQLIHYVKSCFASLFTDRAISYRASRGFDHFQVALSVGVQKMVRSDKASSGVMFSIDTETGFKNAVFITSSWGLGENVVGGTVNPDEFYVFKPTLEEGKKPILKRQLGHKHIKMVYSAPGSEHPTHNVPTSEEEFKSFSLTDEEVLELAKYAVIIEKHYSAEAGEYRPMDMEWAKDGVSGDLFIVQARPETVQSQKMKHEAQVLEKYILKADPKDKKVLVSGKAVGGKIGAGKVRVIESLERINEFQEGEILVTDNTDPDWEPAMKKAAAVVTNRGGRTCHAAIVAREIGVPAIVGAVGATEVLKDGMEVTVSCAEGEEGYVYEGRLPFEVETIDLSSLEKPKTKIYMNVGNPERAFAFAQIPSDGVGLARMEFIINNYIKAHPLALVDMYNGKEDVLDKEAIENIMSGYENPKDFFIKKITEGVGMIAAAFYPDPVIVRTSDFKSNEYKRMVGGAEYEPHEENPMIGYRGASRYYSETYRPAFEWECEALKIVRDEMGLTNMKLMLPFVRTPEEGRKVLEIMREKGLIQGENGLEIYVMCELPSNVILADEFLKDFDGFSIGSNDLTQLTLGVDRDGELVSHIFDERNEAVKRMLEMAISSCKKAGKYVGICGQAPSDYPEIAEFLVENGITSISLNPDSVLSTWPTILKIEEKLGR